MPHEIDPVSVFQEALGSVFGRVLTIMAVLPAGVVFGFLCSKVWTDGLQALMTTRWGDMLTMALCYPLVVLIGCAQIWGVLSYAVILGMAVAHVFRETPYGRLWLIFGLQGMEACRMIRIDL